MLVEGVLQGVPIRLEVGRDPGRVRVALDGSERLVDLGTGRIFRTGGMAMDAGNLPDTASPGRFVLTYWGGKRLTIAGEKGGYFVMTLNGLTCGEALVATWTRPLIGPLVRAIDLLQRTEPRLRPEPRRDCGSIPFRAYATRGWPLLAGWLDARVFATTRIDMEHQPDEGLFRLP
jgi:hypothetical protein